jgi:DNA polymerase
VASLKPASAFSQIDSVPLAPAPKSYPSLKQQAAACRGCDLWRHATQTVFGDGPAPARVMMVGEQPGDKEDLAGHPFVGPAGQLLDRALQEAGVDRKAVYVTNAVKHFKYVPRGKRRMHQSPNAGEIEICRWWLQQEFKFVRPRIVVALGRSAAQSLLGRAVTIKSMRGRFHDFEENAELFVTVHPSSLLRAPDEDERRRNLKLFVADLHKIGKRAAALT